MSEQSVSNQKGEIEFRRKLYEQQVEGKQVFTDEYDRVGIEEVLEERMRAAAANVSELQERGIPISPYLEIGAERCQRSLVMENDFGASGAAVDISFDMLKGAEYYGEKFERRNIPLRVCCDANRLPFLSNAVPFVFCYETLHHFPDPTPIISEIHRVLAPGGFFFFGEEPYKKSLHANLYEGKKIYSEGSRKRSTLKKFLDYFFSKQRCNEVEHGILENHEIPLRVWRRALGPFEKSDVTLRSLKRLHADLTDQRPNVKYLLAALFGGEISGLCRKGGEAVATDTAIAMMLACPSCFQEGHESSLLQEDEWSSCSRCERRFPTREGVLFLLPEEKLRELYPDVCDTFGSSEKTR